MKSRGKKEREIGYIYYYKILSYILQLGILQLESSISTINWLSCLGHIVNINVGIISVVSGRISNVNIKCKYKYRAIFQTLVCNFILAPKM